MARVSSVQASRHLAQLDSSIARVMAYSGPCRLRAAKKGKEEGAYESLVRMIVYQQLAGAAAATIHSRVIDAVGGRVTPASVASVDDDRLRGAGLSGSKLKSIRDLTERTTTETLQLDRLTRRSDEQVIEDLVQVRGIGVWTAQMFLMFQLGRLDVWPVLDLGVRKGYGILYGLPETPSAGALDPLGERFRPYRSVAAWFLWRATEPGFADEGRKR